MKIQKKVVEHMGFSVKYVAFSSAWIVTDVEGRSILIDDYRFKNMPVWELIKFLKTSLEVGE